MAENDLSYSEAAARNLAKTLALVFKSLLEEGLTEQQALELTKAMLTGLKPT